MGVKGLEIEAAECAVKLEAWGQGTKKKEERRKVKEAGGTEPPGKCESCPECPENVELSDRTKDVDNI